MTIILRTVVSGPRGCFQPGQHELDADFERQLVDGGYAEYVARPVAPAAPAPVAHETAVVVAPEVRTAAPRTGRR